MLRNIPTNKVRIRVRYAKDDRHFKEDKPSFMVC